MAAPFPLELLNNGYQQFARQRLIVISAEDCWGQTPPIPALREEFETVNRGCNRGDKPEGRLLLAKAADLLAQARKGINCATVRGA
jgi:hypothetical protein